MADGGKESKAERRRKEEERRRRITGAFPRPSRPPSFPTEEEEELERSVISPMFPAERRVGPSRPPSYLTGSVSSPMFPAERRVDSDSESDEDVYEIFEGRNLPSVKVRGRLKEGRNLPSVKVRGRLKEDSTEIPDDTQPPKSQLIFSKDFELRGEFSSVGGQLQGDSDVILVVPENAIQHPDTVTIAGAVSVDLKTVHDKLGLDQDEVIVSPVIEYVTDREDFVFQKPVRVYLPHFLPGSFSPNDVSVYQFYKGEDGNIHTEKVVRVADEDDVENAEYDGSGGTFCVLEADCVLVLMSHFTGLFTRIKRSLLGPHELHLRLYGEHIQRDTRDVDLYLLLSDKRLTIRDFRKRTAGLEEEDEDKKIKHFTLPAARNLTDIIFGARLVISRDEEMWTHRKGSLPVKTRDMEQRQHEIHRFEWSLECILNSPPEWFRGRLDSGYVASTDLPFRFLLEEEPVFIDLRVNSCTHQPSSLGNRRVDGSDDAGVCQSTGAADAVPGAGGAAGDTYIFLGPGQVTKKQGSNIKVSGTGHSFGNTSTTDSHDTITSHSHNVYHAPVNLSRQHYEGTTVTGNNNQVGNMTTTDSHNVTIQGSFNRQDAATAERRRKEDRRRNDEERERDGEEEEFSRSST